MRRFFLFLLAITTHLSLFAQNNDVGLSFNKRGNRDEIRAGWSFSPLYYLDDIHQPYYYYYGSSYTLGNVYHDVRSGEASTGVFCVEYCHFFKNWLSLCADIGFTSLWNEKTNAFGVKLSPDKGVMFHILPKVRFSYLRSDIVSLYSDIGLGIAAGSVNNELKVSALFHTTPIGITVGKRVYGFAETNLSMKNVGLTIGAGYRF